LFIEVNNLYFVLSVMILIFIDWLFFSLARLRMSVLFVYIQTNCFYLNGIILVLEIFILISFALLLLFTLLFIFHLFYNMVLDPFWVYPNECLLSLSGHPLSSRYRTTHNMLSHHTRVVTLGMRRVCWRSHID